MGIRYTEQGDPCLEHPLEDDIMEFVIKAYEQFLAEGRTIKWLRSFIGKATGYVECQRSYGSLTVDSARQIMQHIREINGFWP